MPPDGAEAEADSGDAPTPVEEPVDDPQLRKGIDYLNERLREKDAATQTASGQIRKLLDLRVEA